MIHRDGLATIPRGQEIFHGTYQDLKVAGESRTQAGTLKPNVIAVDDPDHFHLSGLKYERTTYFYGNLI